MTQKPGRHTPFFELVDAQSMAGCPVCRLMYKATDRYLDGLIYEAVLDHDVRAKTKRSRGFCAAHTDMLSRRPGRALGVALIYRDIIRTIADNAEKAHYVEANVSPLQKLWNRRRSNAEIAETLAGDQPCPACTIGADAERMYIELLLAYLDDDQLYRAYAAGEGLCLMHFLRALEGVTGEDVLQRLVQPQVARYRLMLRDLDEFIRKRDHRFREEKYGEEGDVWLRAMNAIVGGAGMGLSAKAGGRRADDVIDERR